MIRPRAQRSGILCLPGPLSMATSAGMWGCVCHSHQGNDQRAAEQVSLVLERLEAPKAGATCLWSQPIRGKAGMRTSTQGLGVAAPHMALSPRHAASLTVTSSTWLTVWEPTPPAPAGTPPRAVPSHCRCSPPPRLSPPPCPSGPDPHPNTKLVISSFPMSIQKPGGGPHTSPLQV